MPILQAEPNINPTDLLDNDQYQPNLVRESASWWNFCTKSRQEKSLARELLERDLAFYLPLIQRRLLIRSRPVYSQVPLFTGYVFLKGTNKARLRALATNRVAQTIPCHDGQQLTTDPQKIKRLIDGGVPLTVEPRLKPNQRVRIRARALTGLEGMVLKRRNQLRLLVWVTMLQQGVSLDIDDYLLEPISRGRSA